MTGRHPSPQTWRYAASWLVYPGLLAAAFAAWFWARERGIDPAWSVVGVGVAISAAAIVLERILPYCEDWKHSHGDLVTDAVHLAASALLIPELIRIATYGAMASASAWLGAEAGLALWPDSWPLWAELSLALVVLEFGQYWWHRIMHTHPLFWRLHATHHSAPRIYWLNAARLHPFEAVVGTLLLVPVLILLGSPPDTITAFLIFLTVHATLQHSNIEMRLGPLNWIFSQAELHRWHHSPVLEESNTNYGGMLIIWDVVFGTRFLPAGRRPPENTGIGDMPKFPQTYLAQLASPFRWREIAAESGAAETE